MGFFYFEKFALVEYEKAPGVGFQEPKISICNALCGLNVSY
jgi:hypothetical protein